MFEWLRSNKILILWGTVSILFVVMVGFYKFFLIPGELNFLLRHKLSLLSMSLLFGIFLVTPVRFTKNTILQAVFLFVVLSSVIGLKIVHEKTVSNIELLSTLFDNTLIVLMLMALKSLIETCSSKCRTVLFPCYTLLIWIVVTIPLLYWGYFFLSGNYVQPSTILALLQTNWTESKEYLLGHSLVTVFACFVGMLILYYISYKYFVHSKRIIEINLSLYVFIALGIALSGYSLFFEMKNAEPYGIAYDVKDGLQSYNQFKAGAAKRQQRLAQLNMLTVAPQAKGVYVLVIGESQTRKHMSLYGYNRDTTPNFKSHKSDQHMLVFENAFSNHTHTVPVLTYALTEKNQYNNVKMEDATSIIELARAAGYDTYWISNQERYGSWDTPVAEIGSSAQHQVWLNEEIGNKARTKHYDGDLLKNIPDINTINNGLIVFHVMGSHLLYKERYPDEFDKWGAVSSVDQYDNAMLYNDAVVEEIYKAVSKNPNFQAMIFMSDHGEDPDHELGHDAAAFTPQMSQIPFIVYVSNRFEMNRPNLYSMLESHKTQYWTNDLLYNMMITLLGIEGTPKTEPFLDISSPTYDRNKDNLKTLHGKRDITD